MDTRIVTLAGSAREQSVNKRLARVAAEIATQQGAEAVFIDLFDYPMPLYDGDYEATEGIPESTRLLEKELSMADGIFIASPEYNGAFTPLLKNTIDWVTRIDKGAWAKPTMIASATPGKGGGANGLRVLRAFLENMAIDVIEQVPIPHAKDKISETGVDDELIDELTRSITDLVSQAKTRPIA